MTAKEMFEELGYKQIKNKNELVYLNKKENVKITFFKNDYGYNVFIEDDCHSATYINICELQAINKQVSELGWLDETRN